jgi:hypothetical protein
MSCRRGDAGGEGGDALPPPGDGGTSSSASSVESSSDTLPKSDASKSVAPPRCASSAATLASFWRMNHTRHVR